MYFSHKVRRSNLLSVSKEVCKVCTFSARKECRKAASVKSYDEHLKQSYRQHSMGCQFVSLTVCLLLIILSGAFRCLPGFKEQVGKFLVEKSTVGWYLQGNELWVR